MAEQRQPECTSTPDPDTYCLSWTDGTKRWHTWVKRNDAVDFCAQHGLPLPWAEERRHPYR